jgi:hypothetical protein
MFSLAYKIGNFSAKEKGQRRRGGERQGGEE